MCASFSYLAAHVFTYWPGKEEDHDCDGNEEECGDKVGPIFGWPVGVSTWIGA